MFNFTQNYIYITQKDICIKRNIVIIIILHYNEKNPLGEFDSYGVDLYSQHL